MRRVVFFEGVVDPDGAVEIFLIPPSRHIERRHLHLVDVRNHRLALPELVVIRMRDKIVPRRNLSVKIPRVDAAERTEREVPAERVVAIERELLHVLAAFHHCGVLEAVAQTERAVVMKVVAQPHIRRGRLRRDRLQRRVRLESPHDGGPAIVGNAEHADAPVVARNILEQPLDRVVRIGALVERRGIARRARRALHDERPFGTELSAQVLKREDVAFVGQRLEIRDKVAGGTVDAVRRALHDDRQRCGLGGRREDLRVKTHAVSHRDHHVADGEPVGDVRILQARERRRDCHQHENERNKQWRAPGCRHGGDCTAGAG